MKGLIVLELDTNKFYNDNKIKHKHHNKYYHNNSKSVCSVTGFNTDNFVEKTGGTDKKNKHNKSNKSSNDNITYDMIVDLLIKGQKLRHQYPGMDICCRVGSGVLNQIAGSYRILSQIYDRVLETDLWDRGALDQLRESKKYDVIKKMRLGEVGIDDIPFDTDYEYNQVKELLGPQTTGHFMFKERDLEIIQRHGFDFNKNKIKYTMNSDPKIRIIREIYDMHEGLSEHEKQNDTKIDSLDSKYYHIEKKSQYRPFNVTSMFDHVNEFNYTEPLIRLAEYYQPNNHYQQLYDKYNIHLESAEKDRIRLNVIDEISVDDRDTMALQYIKCRPNTHVITLWRPGFEETDDGLGKIVEHLEKNGNIYYIKTVQLTGIGMFNLIFWLYDDINYDERIVWIGKKMQTIDVKRDNNSVCFIVFDNINNKQISGHNAVFKKELRGIVLDSMKNKTKDTNRYQQEDMLHINDYFYQTVESAELFLNKNSINTLNDQDCRIYGTDEFIQSNLRMQTMRKIIYSNMSLLEMDRLLIVNHVVLYAYGVRRFNQSDKINVILLNPLNNQNDNLSLKILEYGFGSGNLIKVSDNNHNQDNDNNTYKINPDILRFLKIEQTQDFVLDPKNFFYFQGIKVVMINFEILDKLIKITPEELLRGSGSIDEVDLIMMYLLSFTGLEDIVPHLVAHLPNTESIINDRISTVKQYYSKEQIDSVKDNEIFVKFFGR